MTSLVDRTCTEVSELGERDGIKNKSRPVEDFQDVPAYVFLGAPGAGKTTEFERQAELSGGCYVPARKFIAFDGKTDWRDQTLFIDGLDEVRAGSSDARTPFDNIRSKLHRLGCPRFRLSCRIADWFGSNDRLCLNEVSPNNKVAVLHLDDLTRNDIREILRSHSGIADADELLQWATDTGIDGLLANPQSLEMLTDAFAQGERPQSRLQVFEVTCNTLVKEHNQEHKIAKPNGVGDSELLEVAGKLCALQLLSGKAGYVLPEADGDADFLELQQVAEGDFDKAHHVLASKLFDSPDECDCTPVHRQVAEFLGARYLAERISEGLPIKRILALITGYDGGIVSELRGLSAWLAAHSPLGRVELIERDPLGVILYGDVRGFSVDDKRRLLDGIKREVEKNPWIVGAIKLTSASGDILNPAMAETFLDILTNPARDEAWQPFVLIVVELLAQGRPVPELADVLMRMLRDSTWGASVKYGAVNAFLRHQQDEATALSALEALLQDVYEGKVPDRNDSLLGYLLSRLYPKKLSISSVLRFLKVPKTESYLGTYKFFWTTYVSQDLSSTQLGELLDEFVSLERHQKEFPSDWHWIEHWQGVFRSLLSKFVQSSGDEVAPDRLFDWLEIASRDVNGNQVLGNSEKELEKVESWLRQRPELRLELFSIGIERSLESSVSNDTDDFARLMEDVEHRLFKYDKPTDFARWCLEKAIAFAHPIVASYLTVCVARAVKKSSGVGDLSRRHVESRLSENSELLQVFRNHLDHLTELAQRLRDQEHLNRGSADQRQLKWQNQIRERQREWREGVKPHEEALINGTAPPDLLGQLATAYLGGYHDVSGNSPVDRLRNLFGDAENLVNAVLQGFRGSIGRDDLPSVAEVVRTGTNNEVHHLSLAFWAGLEELHQSAPCIEASLNKAQLRLALAIHYNLPIWPRPENMQDEAPGWFVPLLHNQPEVVAEVLIRTARSRLRNGADFSAELYHLSHSSDHAAVARLASLPLLKSFPLRCRKQQLSSLSHLLQAALVHCDKQALLELVEQRADQPNMDVAQRVYWLTAGLLASPEAYLERFDSLLAGSEPRVQHLAELLLGRYEKARITVPHLNVAVLSLLIKHLGRFHAPFASASESETGPAARRVINVHGIDSYISDLASISTNAASQALQGLMRDEHLRQWHPRLTDAAYRQNAVRREAEFCNADVDQVIRVLKGHGSANAADLAALIVDKLSEIAKNIRDGNSSTWRQFWNVDSYNHPQEPRPEDAGRDVLLSLLKPRIENLGVDAQPEGRYADDKRCDIRISFDDYNVALEIKKSCHQDLWSAVRTQLIKKYPRDPGAQGYGIYLVLWFGNTEHCRPTPNVGSPPKNAAELETRLLESLSVEERARISICVVDVSKPDEQ